MCTLLCKERRHKPNQVTQRQPVISDNPLNLMKFRQMRRINSLIPKNSIDTKHPRRFKPSRTIRKGVQHLSTRCSRMGT